MSRHRPLRGSSAIAALALAGVVSACAQGEPYESPRFAFLGSYAAKGSGSPVLLSNADWWKRFDDPVLDRLVAEALAGNLNLASAEERVIAARAEVRTVPPAGTVSSGIGVEARNDSGASGSTTADTSLGLSWMLDPYGARREEVKAALARAEVAEAEVDSARLLVLFNLCNAYVDLRYRERLLALRRDEIGSRTRLVELAQSLFEANAATQLDVTRANARLAEVQAQIPGLEAAVRVGRNEIAVLAGRLPGSAGPETAAGRGQPRSKLSADVGIPADLLRNRPDIRIAERLYYAAVADIGVAKADLYPKLSLTGAITLNAADRGGSGRDAYFGPTVQFPVLPVGAAQARVEVRRSTARQAHVAWQATVLGAILEVENALLEYDGSRRAQSAADRSLRLYLEALELTRELTQSGSATIDDLIDAEQSVTDAANTLADTLRQQGLNFVALNVRLGSGNAAEPIQTGSIAAN